MKHLLVIVFLSSLFTTIALASEEATGETSTDCPMMREQNDRRNPKANLEDQIKIQTKRPQSTAQ